MEDEEKGSSTGLKGDEFLDDQSTNNISRRQALARLAKLGAYTAPTVTTLLSAQMSYAQTSEALMDNSFNNSGRGIFCEFGFLNNLWRSGEAIDIGGNPFNSMNDTTGDCGQ